MDYLENIKNRRTFAIVSHPDAGKTTLTEKLLLLGGAIQLAGTVKSRKSNIHAHSDWMALEKERGISITTSVMQFNYRDYIINLLDTPGHHDFSEDAYRTLTAVDFCLMVLDGAKGIEARTLQLYRVCQQQKIPLFIFINKFDREAQDPFKLLDQIEQQLELAYTVFNWPLGMGREFFALYDLNKNKVVYKNNINNYNNKNNNINLDFLELLKTTMTEWDSELFQMGLLAPIFFGSAMTELGVVELLNAMIDKGIAPHTHQADKRAILATEKPCTGFIFKIQANMDPKHRDRMAFLRLCSGVFYPGKKLFQVRTEKLISTAQAITFMANSREKIDIAYPGDIIGLPNHGTIQIGDTFTEGEKFKYIGIPDFAPEYFKIIKLKDPLKSKALYKGLTQLSEEGAIQFFRALTTQNLILGAVGLLQFEIVIYRLKHEYKVSCDYESCVISIARWVNCSQQKILKQFQERLIDQLAYDRRDRLVLLSASQINLKFIMEKWPDITFTASDEH